METEAAQMVVPVALAFASPSVCPSLWSPVFDGTRWSLPGVLVWGLAAVASLGPSQRPRARGLGDRALRQLATGLRFGQRWPFSRPLSLLRSCRMVTIAPTCPSPRLKERDPDSPSAGLMTASGSRGPRGPRGWLHKPQDRRTTSGLFPPSRRARQGPGGGRHPPDLRQIPSRAPSVFRPRRGCWG